MLKIGIIGLPNVGKSTLFNALTGRQVLAENYPFCTTNPNSAIVPVPDVTLERISIATNNLQLMPVLVEYWDIAGLVRDAHLGLGLGNQFLHHIREVDGILHVVRGFTSSNVPHVENGVDPIRDIKIIERELVMADINLADKHRIAAKAKLRGSKDRKDIITHNALDKVWRAMRDEGMMARDVMLEEDEKKALRPFSLLTFKPCAIVLNTDDDEIQGVELPKSELGYTTLVPLNIKLEYELSKVENLEERIELRKEFRAKSSIDDILKVCYRILDVVTFYTFGKGITRAWPIKRATNALEAAGMIHADFLVSFVKAQIYKLADLEKYGEKGSLDRGLVKIVGKNYEMQDGDILWVVTS